VTTPSSYFPSYDGTYNADDDLVAPWWIPGWTSQNRTDTAYEIAAGSENVLGPGFPSLSFCAVTGNYFDPNSSGTPGFITVMMSDNITVTDDSTTYRLAQRLTGSMNQPNNLAYNNWGNGILYLTMGRLNITLFCTDQSADGATITTDSGNDFTYYVTEHFMGGRQYQITVPSADSPGPEDINSLIVSGTVTPYAYDPVWPMGMVLPPPSLPTTWP
jgi:hypothetical protein